MMNGNDIIAFSDDPLGCQSISYDPAVCAAIRLSLIAPYAFYLFNYYEFRHTKRGIRQLIYGLVQNARVVERLSEIL